MRRLPRPNLLKRLSKIARGLTARGGGQLPYRFVIRKWKEVQDINLAARVMGTEYFKNELVPVPLPVESLRSLLVIAPHQDDEVIGAGGAMLLARAAGAEVSVLYVTDGQQAGEPDSSNVRDLEAQSICDALGAAKYDLRISNPSPQPTRDDLRRLAEIIGRVRPQVVMAPWLLDSPAMHRLTNHLLWLADRCFGLPEFEVWGYQVHNTLYPNGYVDITDVAEKKGELIRCYRSQVENYYRYDHMAMGMGAWNSRFLPEGRGGGARYLEVFFAVPSSEFMSLVESFYFADFGATYRNNPRIMPGLMPIHDEVVRQARGGGRPPHTGESPSFPANGSELGYPPESQTASGGTGL